MELEGEVDVTEPQRSLSDGAHANGQQWLVVARTGQAAQWCPQPGDRRGRILKGSSAQHVGQISGSLVEEEGVAGGTSSWGSGRKMGEETHEQ